MSSNNPSATINSSVWQWREWSGLPYLTCELLVDWQHGFFTQQCYPCTPEKLIKALNYQATTYRVKQVHGNTILTPQEIATTPKDEDATFPDADGVITDGLNQGAWVASADCNPVLIGDLHTGRVAAVHAGWRGTAQRIIQKAIARFQEDDSNLADLRIAIGPAISGEVYQVTETVAAEVGKSILVEEIKKIVGDIPTQNLYEENHKSAELLNGAKKDILKALFEIDNSPLLEDEQPGRVRLDIRRVNEIQLQQLGISDQQIAVSNHCTYQQPDYFFSYRRSKQKKVQWSGIVSKRRSK